MESIFNRRSVRNFTAEPVHEDTVIKLLKAAMAAPSAGNQQPWEFIIVRDRSALEEVTKFHEYSSMLKQAPVAIIVCANLQRCKYPVDYWIQDCAAATQNILLAATALNLGSCWLGILPQPERVEGVRRVFSMPDNVVPLSIVALGWPEKPLKAIDRFDATRIHYEKWASHSKSSNVFL